MRRNIAVPIVGTDFIATRNPHKCRLVGISDNNRGLRCTKSNQISRFEKIDFYTIAAARAAI